MVGTHGGRWIRRESKAKRKVVKWEIVLVNSFKQLWSSSHSYTAASLAFDCDLSLSVSLTGAHGFRGSLHSWLSLLRQHTVSTRPVLRPAKNPSSDHHNSHGQQHSNVSVACVFAHTANQVWTACCFSLDSALAFSVLELTLLIWMLMPPSGQKIAQCSSYCVGETRLNLLWLVTG